MKPDKKHEHHSIAESIRHWERLRWVSITVFLVISGGAFQGYSTWDGGMPPIFRTFLAGLGLMITFIFWIQDERIVAYWKSFMERAREIEEDLEIKVFGVTPKRGLFSAGTAVRLLYLLFFATWAALLIVTI